MASNQKTFLVRPLAPEEIRTGRFVAVLSCVSEFLPWYCETEQTVEPSPRQLKWLPWEEPLPFKVKGVCLPFVLAKSPRGELRMLDVRRFQLGELDQSFGRETYRRYRKAARKGGAARSRSSEGVSEPP